MEILKRLLVHALLGVDDDVEGLCVILDGVLGMQFASQLALEFALWLIFYNFINR